jgi:NAD(P)H-dependent flavin oxidoreductase YrpB (nitropropane dioxygenase family)
VVGELLALMRGRGLRRGGGGDQASKNRSRPPSLADYGLGWATAKRWETRARLAPARSFNVRLAEADTLDGIKALVAETSLEARRERERLWTDIQARSRAGRRHETLLTAGQTSGGIKESLPVAEIIRQLTAEAEAALSRGPRSA